MTGPRPRGILPLPFFVCFLLLLTAGFLSAQSSISAAEKVLTLDEALRFLSASPLKTLQFRWDPFFRGGVIIAEGHYLSFRAGNRGELGPVLIDGRDLLTLPAPYLEKGLLQFPEAFVTSLRAALDQSLPDDGFRFRIAAIIVDPGHGGRDSGAIGTHTVGGKTFQVVEKDVTLKVSRELHRQLSAAYPDKQVLLTRGGDTFPSLEERAALANAVPLQDNEAVIFISVHANASFNKTARGYEVWYLTPEYRRTVIVDPDKYGNSEDIVSIHNAMLEEEFTTESIMMAQLILKRFDEALGSAVPSRGIKAEEWFVVRNVRMPSVLVELPFITNATDAFFLSDETFLKRMSEALYKGITDFIILFERSGGFTLLQ
ncbi:MAG: N-acetylmuramoyl-L-alanine amidase [Treponema sp.]|jgi:N-acetylmuramoyl-L-alanine amidase|nr:N-acetylmuramoyl-L-alanine amidase [Treponema sp.]